MEPGSRVRLRADPGRIGIVTGKVRERAGKKAYQVVFPDGASYYRDVHLEKINEIEDDALELLRDGRIFAPQILLHRVLGYP